MLVLLVSIEENAKGTISLDSLAREIFLLDLPLFVLIIVECIYFLWLFACKSTRWTTREWRISSFTVGNPIWAKYPLMSVSQYAIFSNSQVYSEGVYSFCSTSISMKDLIVFENLWKEFFLNTITKADSKMAVIDKIAIFRTTTHC